MFCFVPLFPVKLLGKTWSLLSVTTLNFSSLLFLLFLLSFLFGILNHWSWGVISTSGLKGLLGGVYYEWFLVCIFELILYSLKRKNLLWYLFIDGVNMLNHIIIPRNNKNVTFFFHIWWCIRLLLDNSMMILACPHCLYNRAY